MPLLQAFADGLISAATIALVGTGFSLIYKTHGFFYFAHGGSFTLGAYFVYYLSIVAGLPQFTSIILSCLILTLVGTILEILIFRHLRSRSSSPLVAFLSSLGLFVVIQNSISVAFGDSPLAIPTNPHPLVNLPGLRLSSERITILLVATIVIMAISVALRFTSFGRVVRAISIDPELCSILGIRTSTVLTAVFATGSMLGGLAGILVGIDTLLVPTMGFRGLLLGVAAVVLGGEGGFIGLFLASLAIGLTQHVGTALLSVPSSWHDFTIFLLILIALLIKPRGFLSSPISLKRA